MCSSDLAGRVSSKGSASQMFEPSSISPTAINSMSEAELVSNGLVLDAATERSYISLVRDAQSPD